ncbi:hypothetical protein SUDANB120_06448 (plasmid) [Streptomyces sp. enrichment culture]|uniref:hypothetical protein n=1 Tax=Streptomyces TaxID=1883 RepID=UPI001673D9CC|nr:MULTISPECIES: hypothetical protein [Streptomyces]MBD3575434.1 hypothetical protein [Streptomyces sp. KD18]GGS93218.1 hypothetical protein GCM10010286_17560 [Streptomyces toxytricini]
MGIVITASATATHTDPGTPASAVDLAGRAARRCLAHARVSPSGVGVLVNVGVYRENNTFEPALAALVQKETGINPDYLADPQPAAGFSFDLMDGACGVLSAVQAGQSLLATGTTERLLITAADVHPGGDASRDPDYPYADLAGAFLLERDADPDTGFGPVRHYGGGDRPTDVAGYLDLDTMGSGGRSRITVHRTPGHEQRTGELAAAAVAAYTGEFGLDAGRTLVIGPDAPAGVGDGPGGGRPHTAAPVLGYLHALESARPEGVDTLLFVTAGAGPRAAVASYRPQGW